MRVHSKLPSMPVIQFKGRTAVETYHRVLPHHTLEVDAKLAETKKPALAGNLIIEGDNLIALKSLLPTHAGRIKCIYIDPPYNIGNEGWVYNDNLTQPQFKEWIGKVVGKKGEDATRHDKWCCMMYPRLQLLRELLRDDGAIFVSIDDNEVHHLRMLLDEVFGEENFVANIAWKRTVSKAVSGNGILVSHDHILCYSKSDSATINRLIEADESDYKNPDFDQRGPYKLQKLERTLEGARPTMTFAIKTPVGEIAKTWAVRPETYESMLADKSAKLQMAVTRYEKDGTFVELVADIHMAGKAFFKTLKARLAGYDAVLFEMIGGEKRAAGSTSQASPSPQEKSAAAAGLYGNAAKMLGLADGEDIIDLTSPNMVHADLTAEEFNRLLAQRGESMLSIIEKAKQGDASPEREANRIKLAEVASSGDPNKVKLFMLQSFGRPGSMLGSLTSGGAVVDERNQRCFEVLNRELAAGRKNIAIMFGAAHLPDMEKRLLALGFHQTKQEWLTAWDVSK
jgi:hypothetical protein